MKQKFIRAKQYLRQRKNRVSKYRNIFLISIDTLRADHMGCYGYHRDTTPNIDRLARKGVLFQNAFSVSSWTVPSHMSMFTSLLPSNHNLIFYPNPGKISQSIPLLAEILWKKGYFTLGFHGGGYLSSIFGFNRGFHVYQTRGRMFENNLDNCDQWIKKLHKSRMFGFIHGFNCHLPYQPSKDFNIYFREYKGDYQVKHIFKREGGNFPKTEDDLKHLIALYDGAIKYTDHLIGEFLRRLHDIGIMEDSIVIITSDHGDELNEHGSYNHAKTLYDEMLRVPLILYSPNFLPEGKIVSETVSSSLDIMPTILEILDIPFPHLIDGESLLPLIFSQRANDDKAVFSETGFHESFKDNQLIGSIPNFNTPPLLRSIRTNKWKLIFDHQDSAIELYDLKTDPYEKVNVIDNNKEVVEGIIKKHYQSGFKKSAQELFLKDKETVDMNENVKKQLQDLGYM